MKILTAAQTKILDKITIAEQGIESVDLMERAARAFVTWFKDVYENKYLSSNSGYDPNTVSIFCGLGDNGGDGLAIARMLDDADYIVTIYIVRFGYRIVKIG